MAAQWAILWRCYELLHAVDHLALMMGRELASYFVKYRLTEGMKSDGHLRMCCWMGDRPARTLPQWDGEFEHGGNTDMRNLLKCMRKSFDQLSVHNTAVRPSNG